MKFIAHRGNTWGWDRSDENTPELVQEALGQGFEVEVDVWYGRGTSPYSLGHEGPAFAVEEVLLLHPRVWCHAKTIKTLQQLLKIGARVFYHNDDRATLTSDGYIWTHPDALLPPKVQRYDGSGLWATDKTILVCHDLNKIVDEVMKNRRVGSDYVGRRIAGICSDYVGAIQKLLEEKEEK